MLVHGNRRAARVIVLIVAVLGLLGPVPTTFGGEGPPGGWPWERRPKIHGYDERPPTTPPPQNVKRPPVRYTITITVFPQTVEAPQDKANTAAVMAYVPEDALIWFNDQPTKQRGVLREYESPPLQAGKKYVFHVRLVWFEDGHWVSETKELPVSAGDMTCLYLTKPSAITAALGELPVEDRRQAEKQRFCAAQPETLLGAMGPPVKVLLKGQSVFLCCKDCEKKARKEPDKTLAKAKELAEKNVRKSPK